MKKLLFLFLTTISLSSFSAEVTPIAQQQIQEVKLPEITDEEWFDSLEPYLTKEDQLLIKEYEKNKYSKYERTFALFTKTSPLIQQKSVERFLYPDIDKEIEKLNFIRKELSIQNLDGNPYSFQLVRNGNNIVGDFSIEILDKNDLLKLKKDKYSLYNFSKDFISYYFCSSETLNLWMTLNFDVSIKYNIKNKKIKIITYDLQPQINHCQNYKND